MALRPAEAVTPALRARMAEALAGRAGVDGVRWMLRATAPRAALRRELAALLPAGQPLGPCRLLRAKFKPGRRLNAWYELDLGQAGTRQAAVTFKPAQERAAVDPEVDEAAMAMEAEAAVEGLVAPFLHLRAAAPALGLRALIAPLDPTHPGLVRLSSPRRVPELLAEAGLAQPAGDWAVTAVRYRPGQRHVLRWTPSGGTPLFAKLYRDGDGGSAFHVANQVADLLAGQDGLAAARPLAHLAADDVVIFPLVPGRPLSAELRQSPAVAARIAQAGAVLRSLHAAPAAVAGELPARPFEDDVREVDKAAGHIRFLLPDAGALLDGFLERAGELHRRLPQGPPVFTHGDYKADHLWGSGPTLTVIDFNTCSLADPALDLGKLLADLRWSGRLDPAWARRNLLAGYGPATAELLLRTSLYEALVLAKITVRRVRVADPDWAARTTALLARAAGLLDELERA